MTIKTYKENGKTCYSVSVNIRSQINPKNRKQLKRKGIETKAKAERVEKLLTKQAIKEVEIKDSLGLSWGQVVEKWIEFKKRDEYEPISELTLTDYLSALTAWTADTWNKPARNISRSDIKNIIKIMEERGKSKSYQSKIKGNINRVFIWAIDEDLVDGIDRSPTWGINTSRKSERVPTILNKEEIFKLLEIAKAQNSPWYPIWATALLTGCRNGELYALTFDDIDFTNNIVRVSKSYNKRLRKTKSTKAGYWRNIPMNQDLKSLLLELRNNSTSEFVLPRLRDWTHGYQAKALRNFCMSIGITPIRFHDLRACFATQLLQNGVPPATVMKICGWKDLDTMARYIRLAGIDEHGATDSLSILPSNILGDKRKADVLKLTDRLK